MSLWIPAAFIAAFIVFMIVRAVRAGRRERARMERVGNDLGNRRCPACSRLYGPPSSDLPFVTYIADPGLDEPAYETYWQVRCPACGHLAIAGLPRDTEVMEVLSPGEAEKIIRYRASLPEFVRGD